jgi:hypothetical protein
VICGLSVGPIQRDATRGRPAFDASYCRHLSRFLSRADNPRHGDSQTWARHQARRQEGRTRRGKGRDRPLERPARRRGDMLWSPTIRAALLTGMPWLDVFCPDVWDEPRIGSAHHQSSSVRLGEHAGLGLRCSWCAGSARCRGRRDCTHCHRRDELTWLRFRPSCGGLMAIATRLADGGDAQFRGQKRLEADRKRPARSRCQAGGHRRSWRALHVAQTLQTNCIRLGQLEQGNAAGGHSGEVEAVRWIGPRIAEGLRLGGRRGHGT